MNFSEKVKKQKQQEKEVFRLARSNAETADCTGIGVSGTGAERYWLRPYKGYFRNLYKGKW